MVLTDWPPGPPALKTSILKSDSFISISTSSASGKTATVAADVWTLPCVSVSGILWTLWTPDSYFKYEYMSSPFTKKITSLKPPASLFEIFIIYNFHFFLEQTLSYILNKSAQKSEASKPPVPALISTIAFLLSSSSFGSKKTFKALS